MTTGRWMPKESEELAQAAAEIEVGPITPEECENTKAADKAAEYQRRYYLEHRAEILAWHKQYQADHREEIAQRQRWYNETHRAEKAERGRQYRAAHKAEITEYQRRYREAMKASRAERGAFTPG